MKKLIYILPFLFFACKKDIQNKQPDLKATLQNDVVDEGTPSAKGGVKGKPKPPQDTTAPPVILPTVWEPGEVTVWIDFEGGPVNSPQWSLQSAAPSGLSEDQKQTIFDSLSYDYRRLNIYFTRNQSVYNLSRLGYRQRVIFTTDFAWYSTTAGGVTYNLSVRKDYPNFVFTSQLSYVTKFNWEAGGHELGHAFGLHHIAQWESGVFVSDLDWNADAGEGQGYLMGGPYYNVTRLGIGRLGNGTIQDDEAIIAKITGYK